ncbi:MAG: ATP-dependent DNA helicase RecG [Calditrichia bacterium]
MNTFSQNNDAMQTPVQFLKGVGEKRAEAFGTAGIHVLEDLLDFTPRRYLDRSAMRYIRDLTLDEEVTVMGEISAKRLVLRGKKRLILRIDDGSGTLEVVWFNQPDLFNRIFELKQLVAFSGKVKQFKTRQMVHPDYDILTDGKEQLNTGQLIPLYPSGQAFKRVGLSNYAIRRIVSLALKKYGEDIPETLPEGLVKRYRLLKRAQAFQQMHFPESNEHIKQVWRRFKYEELFYLQLMMALRKHYYYSPEVGYTINSSDSFLQKSLNNLPFALTGAQQKVIADVRRDIASGRPMNRLVQGDVGSGKTVVAFLAMQLAIEAGYQTAIMAPTEILAQQHFINIEALLERSSVKAGILLGSMKAKAKREMQERIAAGEIDLVIGTHALIQKNVQFKQLGFAVIDEQHRFGVLQRGALMGKGRKPHVLVMTATPIPRTLALTVYGDLDVSVIDELPPGRQEIRTYWRNQDKQFQVQEFVRDRINRGEQAYIVYPLVEESEKLDLKAATAAYDTLQEKTFSEFKLGLLHGRLKMEEKDAIMQQFKRGEIKILIATTVIEVGVDVPNATVMVIEHAERFGLSQLHQLRGRVGRGNQQSYCILMTPGQLNNIAQERMAAMEATNDGFRIAEEDLRLRGSGEFFGTRQSGMPDLRFADLIHDIAAVQTARDDAFAIVKGDPHLRKPHNDVVRKHFKARYADKFNMPDIA